MVEFPGYTCSRTPNGSVLLQSGEGTRFFFYAVKFILPMGSFLLFDFLWAQVQRAGGIKMWLVIILAVALGLISVFVFLRSVSWNVEFFRDRVIRRSTWFGRQKETNLNISKPVTLRYEVSPLKSAYYGTVSIVAADTKEYAIMATTAATRADFAEKVEAFGELLNKELGYGAKIEAE